MPASNVTVTTLPPDFDEREAATLRRRFEEYAERGALCHVVVLDRLSTLHDYSVAALIRALRAVREDGGEIRLVADNSQVRRQLNVLGLDKIFPLYHTSDEAMGAIGAPA